MTVINPTPGRIVWYRDETNPEGQPYAAIVTYVHSDRIVNLTVFDHNGNSFPRTSVPLLQDGDPAPFESMFCQWMPYQIGQAKRHAEESSK